MFNEQHKKALSIMYTEKRGHQKRTLSGETPTRNRGEILVIQFVIKQNCKGDIGYSPGVRTRTRCRYTQWRRLVIVSLEPSSR